MTALDTLPDHLRAYGLTVVEVTGWEDRTRPGTFDPIGVIVHHTGGAKGKDHPSLQTCIDGRLPKLPGPLCNVLLGRNCTCYVISAGRCNHAGEGAWGKITDGNGRFIGLEVENNGTDEPYDPALLDASHRATAALLDGIDQPAEHARGHKEWALPKGRKIDPLFDMADYRAAVAAAQRKGTATVPTPPTANPYPAETAEALALLAEHAGYVGDRLWFGPDALAALHRLKNQAVELRKATATNADTITRLAGERDTARANREAAEAEVAQLRKQLQEGGRLPTLLADLDTALVNLTKLGAGLDAAIAKARA